MNTHRKANPKRRRAGELYQQGLVLREIAQRLETPAGTIGTWLARDGLCNRLERSATREGQRRPREIDILTVATMDIRRGYAPFFRKRGLPPPVVSSELLERAYW